ncbi:hypothetical protein BGZ74_005325, partial [Mortierella antarctica]
DGSGRRSVRFDLQGLHRTRYTLRIHEPALLHPKEDRRPATSPEPTTPQCLHCSTDVQNGDDGNVPVQSSTLWSFPGTTDLHQGASTNPTMGQRTRDQDLSIPGRPDHYCRDQGTITDGHNESTTETRGTGIPSQDEQVPDNTKSASGSSRLHNRYYHHVPGGARQQDQGHPTSSQQDGTNRSSHSLPTLIVHRQGDGNAGSSLSSSATDSMPAASQERRSQDGQQM